MKKILFLIFTFIFIFNCIIFPVQAQTETLSNSAIIEMAKAGLSKEIILSKIKSSKSDFDVTVNALIALKKAGVDDEIIASIVEKAESSEPNSNQNVRNFSESQTNEVSPAAKAVIGPKESLRNAKTVAIEKSTLNPSRQALEKELMKRKDWQKYNLTLVRYKDSADIYIEIGRVPFTWLSHRYVFRIYDRRSGTILTAGETTSWGSLAENLAREITQKLNEVSTK